MKNQSLRSSRSYMERQKLAKIHQARTPQIYKKEMPKVQRRKSLWQRFKEWVKKLLGW